MGCKCSKPTVDTLYKPVDIYQFKLIKAIGKGTFGKVCLVEFKIDNHRYALKYTPKDQAIKEKAVHFILQERKILEGLEHPFICSLRFSFQDDNFMYMILDYKEGCDLRKSLKNRRWTEDETRVVIAEVASALEYLHGKNIVHRDLKPDNILLDGIGHAYLSDFNISTVLKENPLKSVAGTEPYMAPELISGQGYLCSVDWWSLGVILYEMVCGERPFLSKNRKELIKNGAFKFPNNVQLSESIKNAICGFLRMDAHARLGVGFEGMLALKKHPYFSKISWLDLKYKGVPPIFVPSIELDSDSGNSKQDVAIEDVIQVFENPINKRKQSKIMSGDLLKIYYGFDYFDHRQPRLEEDPVAFDHPIEGENTSNKAVIASIPGSTESGDWIIRAKTSTGSFLRASSVKNSSFSVARYNSQTPVQIVSPNNTLGSLLGLPNKAAASNKTVEKLKRRHSISMVDSQRAFMLNNQGTVLNSQFLINPQNDPNPSQFIIGNIIPNANEYIPLNANPETMIKKVEVGDNMSLSPKLEILGPIGGKSPQSRRRHSVSGANSFNRPEHMPLLPVPMVGTIEERRSIFLDKSTFLDRE